MLYPSIDKLLMIVDSKYKLVHVSSKRSKQMLENHHFQMKEKEYVNKKELGRALEEIEKDSVGTKIILTLKDDIEDEKYSRYLETFVIRELVTKYSDYIRYPIIMDIPHDKLKEGTKNEYETVVETETLNSMVPIWKKKKSEITPQEYHSFYSAKFSDFQEPHGHRRR